jgi:hypothetical protein
VPLETTLLWNTVWRCASGGHLAVKHYFEGVPLQTTLLLNTVLKVCHWRHSECGGILCLKICCRRTSDCGLKLWIRACGGHLIVAWNLFEEASSRTLCYDIERYAFEAILLWLEHVRRCGIGNVLFTLTWWRYAIGGYLILLQRDQMTLFYFVTSIQQ